MNCRQRKQLTVALLANLGLSLRLAAQQGSPPVNAAVTYTGVAIVDSAAHARDAWRRALTLRATDLAAARTSASEASRAWPTQEAYAWGRAVLAAQAHDTASTLSALQSLADLGLGRDIREHALLAPFVAVRAFRGVVTRLDANSAEFGAGTPKTVLADSTFWPEGIDADPRTGRFYIGSVRHRTIAEVDPRTGTARELLPRGLADIGAILGVRVDTAHNVLWATTAGIPQMEGYRTADSLIASLLMVRIHDGAIQRRWNLAPSPNGHTLGDVALGPDGNVFISDSNDPVLYQLRPGADSLIAFRNPLFRSLQGIAPTPDGTAVYVADYSHGIIRVDLATATSYRLTDAPNSTSLGCDGINWDRGAIICIQNGVAVPRVMRFVLDPDGLSIARADVLDRHPSLADEPTIGTIVNGEFVYVANSQWNKYDDRGARLPGVRLVPVQVVSVPLPR